MPPFHSAQVTCDQVISFLVTTLSFGDSMVWEALPCFIVDSRDGLFKGMHRSLTLPYREIDSGVNPWRLTRPHLAFLFALAYSLPPSPNLDFP